MRIKKIFDSIFVLSKSERNGTLILLSMIFILIIFRFLIPIIIQNNKQFNIDYDHRIGQLEKIRDSLNKQNYPPKQTFSKGSFKNVKKEKNAERKDEPENSQVTLSRFDPNRATFDDLIRLGFSEKAARNLISYKLKGGVIRKSEDLKKIYGIDSFLYATIQPYVFITEEKERGRDLIEINGTDSATLTSLKGIGPAYASRICKYRNYLGGYVSLDQLKEVYQLPEETYLAIRSFLTLDESKVKKININFADVKELKDHPYCTYEDARKIINYRSKRGFIQNVNQLFLDSVIEISVFNRLEPYLKVQ